MLRLVAKRQIHSIARTCGFAALATVVLVVAPAHAQLAGHGGPVRALAVSPDGTTALSGSFDTSAILWSLRRNVAEQVLRLHKGAVNAVAFLGDGRAVTAGEDARIGIWSVGKQAPDAIFKGHQGPIAALAASPGAALLASASWDHAPATAPRAACPARS
jgi:cytochrome c